MPHNNCSTLTNNLKLLAKIYFYQKFKTIIKRRSDVLIGISDDKIFTSLKAIFEFNTQSDQFKFIITFLDSLLHFDIIQNIKFIKVYF